MQSCNTDTQRVLDTSLSCTGNHIHRTSVDLEDDFKTITDFHAFLIIPFRFSGAGGGRGNCAKIHKPVQGGSCSLRSWGRPWAGRGLRWKTSERWRGGQQGQMQGAPSSPLGGWVIIATLGDARQCMFALQPWAAFIESNRSGPQSKDDSCLKR